MRPKDDGERGEGLFGRALSAQPSYVACVR